MTWPISAAGSAIVIQIGDHGPPCQPACTPPAALSGTDQVCVMQDGATRMVSLEALRDWFASLPPLSEAVTVGCETVTVYGNAVTVPQTLYS